MGKYLARDMTYGLNTAFSLPARGHGIRMERGEGCKLRDRVSPCLEIINYHKSKPLNLESLTENKQKRNSK